MSDIEPSVFDLRGETVITNTVGHDPRIAGSMQRPHPLATSSRSFVRFLLFAVGAVCITWPLFSPLFRNEEGDLTGLVCLPLSIGAGTIFFATARGGIWERSVFWFSIAMVGQAASLQLVNAGWQLRYQHYRPIWEILESNLDSVILICLVLQALIVGIYLLPVRIKVYNWIKENFKTWQIVLIGLTFLFSTTIVSKDPWILATEWVFAVFVQFTFLSTILLGALSIPPAENAGPIGRVLERLKATGRRTIGSFPIVVVGFAIFVFATTAALSIFSYERHPHVPDEVAYRIHAKIFASGSLTMAAPPVPEAFETFLIASIGDRWYPAPPPGWPLALAIGEFVGLAWLVNPFLAGINILLAFALLREIYSNRVALIATFLLSLSPWYLFLGMSFMTHMFSLTCALMAFLGVVFARISGSVLWAGISGVSLGMLSLVRPLEAVAIALLVVLFAIGARGKILRMRAITAGLFSVLTVGGLGLAYNAVLTGDPLKFPVNVYTDQKFGQHSNSLGFGANRGMGWELDPYPGHSPLDALINSNLNVTSINTELFGWGMGSLILVALGLFWGRLNAADLLMIALVFTIYIFHFFYYFSGGPDFGARYWFLMILPLVCLAARGIEKLVDKFHNDTDTLRIYGTLAALCVVSLLTFSTWRAVDKYHNFRGMRPDIRYLSNEHKLGRGLILIRGNSHPDYDSAMVYNSVDLTSDAPIYAWARNKDVSQQLVDAFPDRNVWLIDAPSITGSGFRVVAGPAAGPDILDKLDRLK
jgi:hypothetical protein